MRAELQELHHVTISFTVHSKVSVFPPVPEVLSVDQSVLTTNGFYSYQALGPGL